MSTPAPAIAPSYQAAQHAAAWYRVPQPGALRLGGATRQDYLQRQTSNDVQLLSQERAVPSVLTSPSARILEVFTLVQQGEHIVLLTQPGHAAGLAAYFKRHLFFNDQVSIEDASSEYEQIELYGPQATSLLAGLGAHHTPSLDEVLELQLDGQPLHAIGEQGCVRLLLPSALLAALQGPLAAVPEMSQATRELLRIEAGRAGAPEFTDANTPFEVGLRRYVSDTKGCYTGQEVLARQVTYDKVTRALAQLACSQLPAVGAAVQSEGRTIGQVSSVAHSPQHGPLALALLRKPITPGEALQVGEQPARLLSA